MTDATGQFALLTHILSRFVRGMHAVILQQNTFEQASNQGHVMSGNCQGDSKATGMSSRPISICYHFSVL